MPGLKFESNIGRIVKRVEARIDALAPQSPEMRQAMTRIGTLLQTQTKINIRQHGLIDTGRLIKSIRFEHFVKSGTQGIRIGSFAVPYAAAHEFGARMGVTIPAHTRRTPSGGTAAVRAHTRQMNIRERSYLRKAVKKHKTRVINILRQATRPE